MASLGGARHGGIGAGAAEMVGGATVNMFHTSRRDGGNGLWRGHNGREALASDHDRLGVKVELGIVKGRVHCARRIGIGQCGGAWQTGRARRRRMERRGGSGRWGAIGGGVAPDRYLFETELAEGATGVRGGSGGCGHLEGLFGRDGAGGWEGCGIVYTKRWDVGRMIGRQLW